MGELLDRLRQDAHARWAAPAWHPERDGDGIEGVLELVDTRPAEGRRSAYPVLTIRTDDDTAVAWHAAGAIASEQLDLHRPVVGERIAVLYRGTATSKGGSEYKHRRHQTLPTPAPRSSNVCSPSVTSSPVPASKSRCSADGANSPTSTTALFQASLPGWNERSSDASSSKNPDRMTPVQLDGLLRCRSAEGVLTTDRPLFASVTWRV